MQFGNLKPYSVLNHFALLSRPANVSPLGTSEATVSIGATDSSLAIGLAVFEPHPDRRNRANKNDNVCFMGLCLFFISEFDSK